ncbi:hypothetical protein [Specibacter sp. NPDC078692]|uniref:hypothetical protein n=1 Tax=Specibacter sp. NPDC078692 TaxID=3155818 RepID=UPI0034308083
MGSHHLSEPFYALHCWAVLPVREYHRARQGDPLITALSRELGIEADQIATGAGSLAVLAQLLTAYAGPGKEVVFAWRSYEAYPILVRLTGARDI